MYRAALVFHPQSFVGFNKTQLLERHLFSSGFIGSRFNASQAFTSGTAYRQFLPKGLTPQRYHYGVIRIHIQAIGQWITSKGALLDSTNLVIVEGDTFISAENQCVTFCDFLKKITGDAYNVDTVENVGCLGIREAKSIYFADEDKIVTC